MEQNSVAQGLGFGSRDWALRVWAYALRPGFKGMGFEMLGFLGCSSCRDLVF